MANVAQNTATPQDLISTLEGSVEIAVRLVYCFYFFLYSGVLRQLQSVRTIGFSNKEGRIEYLVGELKLVAQEVAVADCFMQVISVVC